MKVFCNKQQQKIVIQNHRKEGMLTLFLLMCFIQVRCQGDAPVYMQLKDSLFDITQITSRYIRFHSVSGNEKEGGLWLKNLCEENGLSVFQMGSENNQFNFSASVYPLSENLPNIVFLNHIDVVHPGKEENWIHPPFSGKITEKEIWGRGAIDNKGAAILQLFSIIEVMRKYQNQKMPFNISFLAVSCEETQCQGGVKYVAEKYREMLNPAVIIGEGAPALNHILSKEPEKYVFGIAVSHKKALWLNLSLKMENSGHASVPPLQYANKEMTAALNRLLHKKPQIQTNLLSISMLKQLGKWERMPKALIMKHPVLFHPLIIPALRKKPELLSLFSSTITLTGLKSQEGAHNVIPNEVTALLDCRLLPGESTEKFIRQLQKRLKNKNIVITKLLEMPDAGISDESNPFYKSLHAAILQVYPESRVIPSLLPNFNDTGVFRSMGIPAYCVLPLEIELHYLKNIHSVNEKIPIEGLQKGKNAYVLFLENCMKIPE